MSRFVYHLCSAGNVHLLHFRIEIFFEIYLTLIYCHVLIRRRRSFKAEEITSCKPKNWISINTALQLFHLALPTSILRDWRNCTWYEGLLQWSTDDASFRIIDFIGIYHQSWQYKSLGIMTSGAKCVNKQGSLPGKIKEDLLSRLFSSNQNEKLPFNQRSHLEKTQ